MGEPIGPAKGTVSAKRQYAPILAGSNFLPIYLSSNKKRKVRTEQPPYAGKFFFHLELIMGEPVGPAKGTGSAKRL